jgi:dienelactone hydrolase
MPDKSNFTRRRFVELSAVGTAAALLGRGATALSEQGTIVNSSSGNGALGSEFLITPAELVLKFSYPDGERRLSFKNGSSEDLEAWRNQCKAKLGELLSFQAPEPCPVKELRRTEHGGIVMQALVMQVSGDLSIPAYLLLPRKNTGSGVAVMAIHGHGEVEPCIGLRDDYHHQFALRLAQQGHLVLCPELRGFGVLSDLAKGRQGYRLDYWPRGKERQFTLATDSFLKRQPLIGTTVEDLLRWEDWLDRNLEIENIHAVGISYGGDLALLYPVFSSRVDRIFASGTLGSFRVIFSQCYNAPAHCIPGILEWMDRSDIAGLNAPRPITLQYGELDVPGPHNASAAYNATVALSVEELKAIYARMNAAEKVRLVVSKGMRHEMDVDALLAFLGKG